MISVFTLLLALQTTTHSTTPLIRTFDNLLTTAESSNLITLVTSRLISSTIVTSDDEKALDPSTRTSSTCWIPLLSDPLATKIGTIASSISRQPFDHLENLQVARYTEGQQYKLHVDTVPEFANLPAGHRIATLIVYLNGGDDFAGGTTHFPYKNITITPQSGRGLYFNNLLQNDGVDYDAAHIGSKVTRGEKFIVTCWIHAKPTTPKT